MRDVTDLKNVRIEILAQVQLDMERVEDDPVWRIISGNYDTAVPAGLEEAINAYVRAYLNKDVLLAEHPATCGPATMQAFNIIVGKESGE